MPLQIIHLSVAKNIALRFKLGDLSQFYLGSISPDAIHMRHNYSRLEKRKTHLNPINERRFDVNEREFIKVLLSFVKSNKDKCDLDFLWGYLIHILTDVYWITRVAHKFVEDYEKDTSPTQDLRDAYYSDTNTLDQLLFNESIWMNNVLGELKIARATDFLDLLTGQEINLWREHTLNGYNSGVNRHKNLIKYIDKKDIENFIIVCSESIMNDINFVL